MNVQLEGIYVDIWFRASAATNTQRLEHLVKHRELVERTFGAPLSWEALEGRRGARIGFYGEGALLDEENWPTYQDWLAETAIRFLRVTELEVFQELQSIGD